MDLAEPPSSLRSSRATTSSFWSSDWSSLLTRSRQMASRDDELTRWRLPCHGVPLAVFVQFVPHATTKRGQQPILTDRCRWASAGLFHFTAGRRPPSDGLPKLRTRVRFPSPLSANLAGHAPDRRVPSRLRNDRNGRRATHACNMEGAFSGKKAANAVTRSALLQPFFPMHEEMAYLAGSLGCRERSAQSEAVDQCSCKYTPSAAAKGSFGVAPVRREGAGVRLAKDQSISSWWMSWTDPTRPAAGSRLSKFWAWRT